MAKQILINKTVNEIRIALLENGKIRDYLVTRESPQELNQPAIGDIYLAKVTKVLPGLQSAFVDMGGKKSGFLSLNDATINSEIQKPPAPTRIEKLFRKGDNVFVQIVKEPISSKGYRVTRQFSFAGHYLVYLPGTEYIGVSHRIEDIEERKRLQDILKEIKAEDSGLIARTISEKQNKDNLEKDYKILHKTWKSVQQKIRKQKPPKVIYRELSFIEKNLRDITSDRVELIHVDNYESYKIVKKFIKTYLAEFKIKVLHFEEDLPIFEYYNIAGKIKYALSDKIYLKSGGSIYIEQTEALVSIDVNTGKLIDKKTPEENILKANLEAVNEIALQLILRNCGGIIVIDFIDMNKTDHQEQVHQKLMKALKKDRAKTTVFPFSSLGLIEMTRKRTRDNLSNTLCEPCYHCNGSGKVKSVSTICCEISRDIEKMLKQQMTKKITILSHPLVVTELLDDSLGYIRELENKHKISITVHNKDFHRHDQYELH